jgi:hypothetical protein
MLLLSNRLDLGVAHFDPEYLAHFYPFLVAHFNLFYVVQYVRILPYTPGSNTSVVNE